MLTEREKKIAMLSYQEGCKDTTNRIKFEDCHFRRKTDTPFGYARCWAINNDHENAWGKIEDNV